MKSFSILIWAATLGCLSLQASALTTESRTRIDRLRHILHDLTQQSQDLQGRKIRLEEYPEGNEQSSPNTKIEFHKEGGLSGVKNPSPILSHRHQLN